MKKIPLFRSIVLLWLVICTGFARVTAQTFPLKVERDRLVYLPDAKGNRILDFSTCGYKSSNQDIPAVLAAVLVSPKEGDNSARIQQAIDYVSSLPLNKEGFRGTVLLDKGVFELSEGLHIAASGVVLQGINKEQTILLKKGVDRGALLRIEGKSDIKMLDTLVIAESYIPVNSTHVRLAATNGKIHEGSRIFIIRPSTKEWIASLGCDVFGGGIGALGWKPGEMDLHWDRTVTQVTGNQVEFDAPITVALDVNYGGGQLVTYQWNGRINNSGISNITLLSDYDKNYPKDEDHCWTGISVENAENCFVQKVNFKHFAGSAVVLQPTASKVTVEDCISLAPVSEIGGMRRSTFLTYGQQNLFQRCYSEYGIHDFAVGYCAAGPNAFVQCESKESFSFSGSIDSWACGVLFDVVNIDGHNLSFKNLWQGKNGAGWNTANSLFWQCTAAEIECYSPAADAANRAYGCWAQFSGDGDWAESNNHVQPRSFFYAQLKERLGKDVSDRARILPMNTNASSSPDIETAMHLAQEAKKPKLTLEAWINQSELVVDIPAKLKSIDDSKWKKTPASDKPSKSIQIINGRLTMDGALLTGGKLEVPWWSGKLRTQSIQKAGPHITRFVPGREGQGLTDRIDSVIAYMNKRKIRVIDHNYGLWYDRRRDDHERIRRRDGDVWGPFYEQPFARTNSEKMAWEGLSKYDLTRPNAWYWSRLKEFADKGAKDGLLLFHENYFQHNILEAGAHWVDSPWRTANNVNDTDFPEPVHFAGDKRIFVAEMFYDITHPVRRKLHKDYIRQCLDNFADNENVVQLISEEYTGPLHFTEFWLDVIAEWEAETGKQAKVALSATKDVQDAILSDPKRAAVVDIIDIRYWHYKNDGTVYAPEGGKNLAPRQHARKMKVGKVTFEEAYKAVSEYRSKYPEKAVTYYAQNYPAMAWAVLMAGGSCPVLRVDDLHFLTDVAQMEVEETGGEGYKKLVKSDIGCVIYSYSETSTPISLADGRYTVMYINPSSGQMEEVYKSLKINGKYTFEAPKGKVGVYWFYKK
ncbi:DUF6298 domain-containing protein [Bacteroides sp. 224]|uniref:DUF6298 domain-containing protein n=1 Tax=Bacteroides sp. 224 TaxID=2302936 RepID=UPI0013CFA486|nr:DUF6298 domain-containing protein [Bacteroides sp. 224]NDV64034.1 pectate lyase [Bacteroides sp. 224]